MQLTDKKLKQLIKESVVEALQENEVYKMFISECIKNTFELISEHLILDKKPQVVTPEEKVRNTIKNRQEIRESPKKDEIINADILAARKMLESEFMKGSKIPLAESASVEDEDTAEDDEIYKLIGVKKR